MLCSQTHLYASLLCDLGQVIQRRSLAGVPAGDVPRMSLGAGLLGTGLLGTLVPVGLGQPRFSGQPSYSKKVPGWQIKDFLWVSQSLQ